MRIFISALLVGVFFNSSAGVFGAKIKGGVQRLMDTVVDVIVSDKNDENLDGKPMNGAGFLIDGEGYIVTNCHVVDSAEKIKVITSDGNEYYAKLVGKDDRSDVALLKIDADNGVKLLGVQFADSDKVEICDPVIAIGNPFGLGKTVTAGIVSYKGRNLSNQISELGEGGDLVSYIQTDASVNYGNSGGPLFSETGEVIGMITVFMLDGLHSTGINFAIPSNMLKKVINQLRVYGKMQRSWLGISVCRMSREAAKLLLGNNVGYYVTRVQENSTARSGGMKVGDVVLSINGETISENTNIEYLLNNLPIGAVVPIQIMRNGVKRMLSVTVGTCNDEELLENEDINSNKDIPYETVDGLDFGLTNLTKELREIFKIPSHESGVLVSYVDPSSNVDIGVGNLIQKVNQSEVKNLNDLKKEVENILADKEKSRIGKVVLYVQDPLIRKSSYVVVKCRKPTAKVNLKTLPSKSSPRL